MQQLQRIKGMNEWKIEFAFIVYSISTYHFCAEEGFKQW